VPSRMDLGKSKYGGPFTTEQVEDVKSFLKLLVMPLPIFITLLGLQSSGAFLVEYDYDFKSGNCNSSVLV